MLRPLIRRWSTQYCVGCHNTRNPLPAGAPLALDKANFTDPAADAATWERVIKKLGVGAMPPQGSPTPGHAELSKFRAALIASLDAAAAKKATPGRFVLHRLNRLEYANAVRDLLGVTVDVSELLPSDGGNFGFDNIAAALTDLAAAARALSDRRAAHRRARGWRCRRRAGRRDLHDPDDDVAVHSTWRGCRSARAAGSWCRITSPPTASTSSPGRLLKTVAEGLVGVEGHETPHNFIVTIDGKQVFSAPVGGKEDHEAAKGNTPVAREVFDKRMTSPRIKVTAGLHDVGFTFVERPHAGAERLAAAAARQPGSAQPVRHAAAAQRDHRRAVQRRPALSEMPSRQRLFVCKPMRPRKKRPVRERDPLNRCEAARSAVP